MADLASLHMLYVPDLDNLMDHFVCDAQMMKEFVQIAKSLTILHSFETYLSSFWADL